MNIFKQEIILNQGWNLWSTYIEPDNTNLESVFSEIINPNNLKKIRNFNNVKGIILSGGPSTVTKSNFQTIPKNLFEKKIPILGICYGLQLIAKLLGGKIKSSKKKKRIW